MRSRLTDGRLGAAPARLLTEQVTMVELSDELEHVETFILIDLAHTLMCTRQGIFAADQGRALAAALLKLLDGDAVAALAADPEVGTITLQIERYLETECGPAGLDIQRARSRIDQNSTGLRMANREGLLEVLRAGVVLARSLLEAAVDHDAVVAPGYTHLQHAQPTTLGHYFNAHYWNASRNVGRLIQTFDRLDESPLGGAAHSGTSWPIDRRMTARYLGFSRPVPNARDAGMSAFDGGAELTAVLGMVLAGASRCASDLYYWSSSEVGLVRLDASLCGTSSMMPQKRNPIALERIRGLAGEAAGWTASQLGILHFATSTDSDQAYTRNRVPSYCAETAGALGLMAEVLGTLSVDREGMARSAGANWSTASAVADELVSTQGLSYRAAHEVVARLVAEHDPRAGAGVEMPLSVDALTSDRLAELLDPEVFVQTRSSEGAASPENRHSLNQQARQDLVRVTEAVELRCQQVRSARQALVREARELAANVMHW